MMSKRWLPLNLNDKGIAMFSAIFVMLIISILALQFHFTSRQAQSTAFRFQASEIARQLAEAAMDEAFLLIFNETGKPSSALFKKLKDRSGGIDCSSTSLDNLTGKGVPIDVNLTRTQAASIQNGEKFDIEAVARIIDFRNTDSEGGQYYGKEGIGTLEIKVSVTPKPAYQKQIQGACNIYRHHDYKVASIVSKRDNSGQRTSYVQNYVLDYALFLKNGQEEFDAIPDALGINLNPVKQKLVIDQTGLNSNQCGKIFFGNSSGRFVFLNIDNDRKSSFIPKPLKIADLVELDEATTDQVFPELKASVRREVKKQVEDKGASLKSFKMWDYKSFIAYSRHPIDDTSISADAEVKDYRDLCYTAAQTAAGRKPVPNFFPGLKILPENRLADFIEGDVRQRYFHFAYLYADLTNAKIYAKAKKGLSSDSDTVTITDSSAIEKMKNRRIPIFDIDELKTLPNDKISALTNLIDMKYIKDNYSGAHPAVISKIPDNTVYNPNTSTTYPHPIFFNYRDPVSSSESTSASIPYAHANLWARRKLSNAMAEEFGILEPKNHRINLRGIIQINEPITIGADGIEVKVHGQGVLIAPGITIKAGIKKADAKSLCVLLTRGYPINVETDQELETSLISIGKSNRNGHIKAKKQLKLKGALAVDLLRLDQWAEGVNHTITYDPALKPSEDQYQISISRWVSFQKMVEHED
ncbi:MAG: hypothetical protein AB1403_12270 [Candidatus Riflebacteria bacterium]